MAGDLPADEGPRPSRFEVGQQVRVLSMRGDSSKRAVVSIAHGDVEDAQLVGIFRAKHINMYDVLYDRDEEINVPEFRIMSVEGFETQPLSSDPETLKNQGNVLFNHKDYVAAIKFYQHALLQVEGALIGIGNTVVVVNASNVCNYATGLVALAEAGDFEVMLENSDEEVRVAREQLVCVSDASSLRALQVSVYKNLSRCAAKQLRNGWALRYANLAVAIARTLRGDSQQPVLTDCLVLRAKLLLQVNRHSHVLGDVEELQNLDRRKSAELRAQLTQGKARKQASDRKLAKEVAKWVDTAMQQGHRLQQGEIVEDDLPLEAEADPEDSRDSDCRSPPFAEPAVDRLEEPADAATDDHIEIRSVGNVQVVVTAVLLALLAIGLRFLVAKYLPLGDMEDEL